MARDNSMTPAARRGWVAMIACLALLALAIAQPQPAEARGPDKICGVVPGEGYFNYFKVWNVGCSKSDRVSRRAEVEFCGKRYQRCDVLPGEFKSGRVKVGGWRCKMRIGYESYRARCFRGKDHDPRFVHRAGA
jgi:hypothetical protein